MSGMLSPLGRVWAEASGDPLAEAVARARAAGKPVIDLVTTNPHEHGLVYTAELLEGIAARALEAQTVRVYTPDPFGQRTAREAVSGFYARRNLTIPPERIALTPGTSMAYWYALTLLTRPGDDVLVPAPGYPLLDNLAALRGVRLRQYHLCEYRQGWRLDPDELAFQVTPRSRVLMMVSPHNPTGMVLNSKELGSISALCREHRIAAVFDEVFSEFLDPPGTSLPRADPGGFPLVLFLNGFSKMFSLPGWKFGWMAAGGEEGEVRPFLRALEQLSDTFLPVNELVQAAAAEILAAGDPEVSQSLAREYAARRDLALELLPAGTPRPEGGIYLCPRLPEGAESDVDFARLAVEALGVLVHPGSWYGLPRHAVLTAVARPDVLRPGLKKARVLWGLV